MNDERYFLSVCQAPEEGTSFIKLIVISVI